MSDDQLTRQAIALIVDDDPTMRMLARQVLEQIGLEVEEAGDGQEAVRLFKQVRPAIVLLDVLMPVMDGFEACHAIRHLPGGTHTPILIMTGLDDIESIEKAYEVGATDFIAKPWQILILSHRVRYMLRTGRVLEALRESQAGLARAQQLAHLGSWTWTLRTNQFTVSDEVFRILGLSPDQFDRTPEAYLRNVHPDDQELVRQSLEEALALRQDYEVDYRIIRPGGEERIVTERGAPSCDEQGHVLTVTGTIQDITVRRNAEAQMFLSTFYDRLTNLPNRLLFEERLRQAVESAQQSGEPGAVLVLNLDHFRRINETMGLMAGDEVLHAVADRLQDCVRKADGLADFAARQHDRLIPRGGEMAQQVFSGIANEVLVLAGKVLERRGLVKIATGKEDKRSKLLSLTAAGSALLAEAAPIWKREHAALEKALKTPTPDQLRNGLVALS